MEDYYYTLTEHSEGIFKDRGSKFIAHAFPVETEEQIAVHLANLRKQYYDARHHCYAYMLGIDRTKFRANDDGEPNNSAGQPILGQIKSFELTNVLIVVIRYFGGTLLGVGGLVNAYKTAAKEAIEANKIIKKNIELPLSISFDYPLINAVNLVVKEEELSVLKRNFEASCEMQVGIKRSKFEKIKQRFEKIHGITIKNS
ncbi:MAG TPA: YigZ family protein [Bacteroidales bacterium]|nr:YigZ family protein [Bacteroidales bacterium]